MTTTAVNPLTALIASADEIRSALLNAITNLELAIEADAAKRRTAKEAKETYDDAAAEWEADALLRDRTTVNGDGKATKPTVDVVKAIVAAELVKARQAGPLAKPWALMNAAAYDADDARMALEQAAKRYRAVEAAADLTAAMLKAAVR